MWLFRSGLHGPNRTVERSGKARSGTPHIGSPWGSVLFIDYEAKVKIVDACIYF